MPESEQAFLTYYALDAVNHPLKMPHDLPGTIEIAYLPTAILIAAGLPLDAVHQRRLELMRRHHGLMYFAGDGGVAAQFNQRLINAGLVLAH